VFNLWEVEFPTSHSRQVEISTSGMNGVKDAPRSNSNFSKSRAEFYVNFSTRKKGIGILIFQFNNFI